jgi:hypothetical protein
MCVYSTALGDSEKPLSTLRGLQSLRVIQTRRCIDHLAQAAYLFDILRYAPAYRRLRY